MISNAALASPDDRTRWGADTYFRCAFRGTRETRGSLAASSRRGWSRPNKARSCRLDATNGLWQFWFWSRDTKTKSEHRGWVCWLGSAKPNPPMGERELQHAIYNLADENIRYLYNNWVPLLARQEDREQAGSVDGLAIEARLADKFADSARIGDAGVQKKQFLTSLTELAASTRRRI